MHKQRFKEYLGALWTGWGDKMSGRFYLPIGIVFAIFAISTESQLYRWILGLVGLAALLWSGYQIWLVQRNRVDELEQRLKPKLRIDFDPTKPACVHRTAAGGFPVIYVRVLPRADGHVTGCIGFIKGVYIWDSSSWQPTGYDERLDLIWSNKASASPLPVQEGIDQYLDVFRIYQGANVIELCALGIPVRASGVFKTTGTYRIDLGVMGDGGVYAELSLKVEMAAWGSSAITVIKSSE